MKHNTIYVLLDCKWFALRALGRLQRLAQPPHSNTCSIYDAFPNNDEADSGWISNGGIDPLHPGSMRIQSCCSIAALFLDR